MGLLQQLAQNVPPWVLVRLNRHARLKTFLRERLSPPPDPAGTFQAACIRKGVNRGAVFTLDMTTDERRLLAGTYEPWIHATLPKVFTDGMNMWDVGAHIGYYAVAASRLSPTGRHLALEPGPSVQARLAKHLKDNNASNVSLLSVAAGSTRDSVSFAEEANGAVSRVSATGATTVPCVLLDDLLDDHAPPDLVLMDIEGHEADALLGAEALLTAVRPMWLMELHGEGGLTAHRDLISRGYRWESAVPSRSIEAQLEYQRAHVLYRPE